MCFCGYLVLIQNIKLNKHSQLLMRSLKLQPLWEATLNVHFAYLREVELLISGINIDDDKAHIFVK